MIQDGTLKHNFREKTFSLGTHAVRHESHASLLEGVPYHITKRGNGRQRAFFEECLPHRHCQRTPHGTPRSPAWLTKPIQQSRPDPIFFPPQNQPLSRKSPNPCLTRWEIMILKGAPSMQMQTRSLPFTLTPFRFAKSGVFRSVFSCWSVPIGGLNILA